MVIPITTFALAGQLTVAVADTVPHFNLKPVCQGIAQHGGLALEPNRTVPQALRSCIKSEMAIRRQLVQQWSTFKPANKANCMI
jgi:hypothetical protein